MSKRHAQDRRQDEGFTLVEMLLVMVVLGVIMTALATVVTVVLRTAPPAEVRADDARSVQGLVTWIPQDVDAAPPSGFNTDITAWPCGGAAPAVDSHNLLAITWSERTDLTTTNFAASYRYERVGQEWRISRYSCDNSSGAMSTPHRQNLTAQLPAWDTMAPPAAVTMCRANVDNNGDCPAGDVITTTTSPDVQSLKIRVTRIDGVVSTIDAAPKNPDQDLADDPLASTNHYPTVARSNFIVDVFAGGPPTTIDLDVTHDATDLDGDTLSVAIDSSEPFPANVTASTSDPLFLTVAAAPSLPPGTITPNITLIISDPFAGWVSVTVTVRVIPEPNLPPTVAPDTYHLQVEEGETVVLPLAVTHGLSDPNGDSLTVTPITWPTRMHMPSTGHPGPTDLELRVKPSVALGPSLIPVELFIEDGRGGSVSAWITVDIVAASTNSPPTASTSNINVDMYAGDTFSGSLDLTHGVTDPDLDPLTTLLDSTPAGITTNLSGGLSFELVAAASLPVGTLSPVRLDVVDPAGEDVEVTITVTIIPTPPPPSDCVLGTLTATPSSVGRQGSGGPRLLRSDVTVRVTYTGSCDGLVLNYNTGDTSGLGVGSGRVFPPGSPASITIFGRNNGGTEKWLSGTFTLTASTTSAVTPNQVTTTLTVT